MKSQEEDRDLIRRFKNKESRSYAFNLIVRKYQERVYWHIRKIVLSHEDADDITQDTFIKAYKGLEKFREDAQLFTWLYRIATNESLNHLKKVKRKKTLSIDDQDNIIEQNLVASNDPRTEEVQKALQKALIQLPDKQRVVFNMKYFDDMKYEEMSKVLETSVGALKASYHHAVKKIEQILNPD